MRVKIIPMRCQSIGIWFHISVPQSYTCQESFLQLLLSKSITWSCPGKRSEVYIVLVEKGRTSPATLCIWRGLLTAEEL